MDSIKSGSRPVRTMTESTPNVAPARRPSRAVSRAQSVQNAGALASVMLIYIICTVGRIGDLTSVLYAIPLAKIVAVVAIVIALQSRTKLSPTPVWSRTPARLILLIMMLIAASMVFSVLRHATFNTIKGTALSVTVGLILMIKSGNNWQAVKRLLLGCALSTVVLAVEAELTRYAGRAGYTPDMDPNDFAFVFSGLLPIVVAFTVASRGFKKLCFAGLSIWIVLEILLTESRGGLLGLLSVVAMMVVLLPTKKRNQISAQPSTGTIITRILALIIAGFLAWHAIPSAARTRLASIDSVHHDYNLNLNDPTGRLSIWLQTLPLALRRPWGWGAGAFNTADGKYGGGRYKAAHNMYLQALVELGFMGFALFVAAIVSGMRRLGREASAQPPPTDQEALEKRLFARAMLASFTGICISGFFLAELYSQIVWTLLILTCLVGRAAVKSTKMNQRSKARF